MLIKHPPSKVSDLGILSSSHFISDVERSPVIFHFLITRMATSSPKQQILLETCAEVLRSVLVKQD